MRLQEVKTFLTKRGFNGLQYVSHSEETKTFNFKYTEFNDYHMGIEPTVAAKGQVAVYNIPEVGKIGVSPNNRMVRFIDAGKAIAKKKVNDSHLGFVEVTPELTELFNKAVTNSTQRVPYMKALWHYLNTEKFQGRMKEPELKTGPRSGSRHKNARGVYFSTNWHSNGPGKIWMADFMFNAREPFFLEVFLHEMCHQAAREIDRDSSYDEQGHGPVWQKWMRHAGLDPRRFDPTDDYEYKSTDETMHQEEQLDEQFGPRQDGAELAKLKKLTKFEPGPCFYVYKSRAIRGVLQMGFDGKSVIFEFKNPKGQTRQLSWKTLKLFNSGKQGGLIHCYHIN